MRQGDTKTITFTTLRLNIEPTADNVLDLVQILESLKDCGAGDRYHMELVIHVAWDNTEKVKQALCDLESIGLINSYMRGTQVGQVESFKKLVFK